MKYGILIFMLIATSCAHARTEIKGIDPQIHVLSREEISTRYYQKVIKEFNDKDGTYQTISSVVDWSYLHKGGTIVAAQSHRVLDGENISQCILYQAIEGDLKFIQGDENYCEWQAPPQLISVKNSTLISFKIKIKLDPYQPYTASEKILYFSKRLGSICVDDAYGSFASIAQCPEPLPPITK